VWSTPPAEVPVTHRQYGKAHVKIVKPPADTDPNP
jgi:hypothetical protein